MRQAVYGTARLGLHREFSDRLKEAQGGGTLPAWKSVLSSMGSGAIASVVGTPFDIALVRMQADTLKPVAGTSCDLQCDDAASASPRPLPTTRPIYPAERRNYKHVFDALARITREEGVTKLWRGFEPTVSDKDGHVRGVE